MSVTPTARARSRPSAYQDALARLYARSRQGAPRDPARTRRLLDALSIPDPLNVAHVVGTNGKGAVACRIDAGLRAAGLRSVRFLSPHVESFAERIALDGRPVTPEEVMAFLDRLSPHPDAPPAAFFEVVTAMALDLAARGGADWAVLEAGVGAARDATRAVNAVRVVVITNVSLDHADVLGPDVAAIAEDKAAAIRPGVPVVTAADGEALQVVRAVAAARDAPLHVVRSGRDRGSQGRRVDAVAQDLAAAALRCASLPAAALPTALAAAARPPALPARREAFFVRGRDVLLDGAHNRAAAEALAEEVPAGAHLLLGIHGRKDADGIRAALAARAARVRFTAPGAGIAAFAGEPGFDPDPRHALLSALGEVPPGGLLVVAGSFYLAGSVRPWLRAHHDPGADRRRG
ncbi:MAG: bifunctional folylpolyglutamate synthase/dihydrofolate synthase [Trueperaceae bacterium]|nr:bifunctional folylpolyglutamate synthase/dihydrofolate synthase [Trueperaceae bacterium]